MKQLCKWCFVFVTLSDYTYYLPLGIDVTYNNARRVGNQKRHFVYSNDLQRFVYIESNIGHIAFDNIFISLISLFCLYIATNKNAYTTISHCRGLKC